jgi:hypothetical protein
LKLVGVGAVSQRLQGVQLKSHRQARQGVLSVAPTVAGCPRQALTSLEIFAR